MNEHFTVTQTPEQQLQGFLQKMGVPSTQVEGGNALQVSLSHNRTALLMASGTERNTWHVVADNPAFSGWTSAGAYGVMTVLHGLMPTDDRAFVNRWRKARRLVDARLRIQDEFPNTRNTDDWNVIARWADETPTSDKTVAICDQLLWEES